MTDTAWLKHLEREYRGAFLAVPMVSTTFLPDYIAGFLDIVMPADLMDELDRSLRVYFKLEESAG